MFGYIRPHKAELKVKEFVRYRSVYCGICKTISAEYGQLPRLATTYDMTFLGLMLLALEEESHGEEMDSCILHPGMKNPMAHRSSPLDFTAAAAVLLGWYKFRDNLEDGEKLLSSQAMRLAFGRAKTKASFRFPELDLAIQKGLEAQRAMEKEIRVDVLNPAEAVRPFGELLGNVLALAPLVPEPDAAVRTALVYIGQKCGEWIYLIDALDDFAEDSREGRWNPLLFMAADTRDEEVTEALKQREEALDLTAALLPYFRDGAILGNIIQMGLPAVRAAVSSGQKLTRV